jgi:periodic tryptophan protein 2
MSCVCYSQDGQFVVTGGDDGKVKLWNTQTGYCFVTFTDHSSSIQAVEFSKKGQVVFSASLDGTIRAFDMVRYRNFRTFTAPTSVQFGSLAVDPSGDIVCAGSVDTFEVYVWSVQSGKVGSLLQTPTPLLNTTYVFLLCEAFGNIIWTYRPCQLYVILPFRWSSYFRLVGS